MEAVKLWFYLILNFLNLDFGILNDDFYKKFHQTDYKVDFEREVLSYVNHSYGNFSHCSFKYNRTHFAINATVTLKIDMGNGLEVVVQGYKFLSNEYRVFPMRFQINLCKAFNNDISGLKSCAKHCGNLKCPLEKNIHYSVCNCLFDESKWPPLIPNGRFKLSLKGEYKKDVGFVMDTYMKIYRPMLPKKHSG